MYVYAARRRDGPESTLRFTVNDNYESFRERRAENRRESHELLCYYFANKRQSREHPLKYGRDIKPDLHTNGKKIDPSSTQCSRSICDVHANENSFTESKPVVRPTVETSNTI